MKMRELGSRELASALGDMQIENARLSKERDELREALIKFAGQVEKLAFNIPPPNPYTPNFVSLAIAVRNWANTGKDQT